MAPHTGRPAVLCIILATAISLNDASTFLRGSWVTLSATDDVLWRKSGMEGSIQGEDTFFKVYIYTFLVWCQCYASEMFSLRLSFAAVLTLILRTMDKSKP